MSNDYKENVNVGDVYLLPQDILAIQHDNEFSDGLVMTVRAKYPEVALLEKRTKKGDLHRQCVLYRDLITRGTLLGQGI